MKVTSHKVSKVRVDKQKKSEILRNKKKLAGLVKQHGAIWDLGEAMHCRPDALASAWFQISVEMGLTVTECKKLWKSLNDALHYQCGKQSKKKGKSGDPAPISVSGDEENSNEPAEAKSRDLSTGAEEDSDAEDLNLESWEMWEDMKFLKEQKCSRTTTSSLPKKRKINDDADFRENPSGSNPESGEGTQTFMSMSSTQDSGQNKSNYAYAKKVKVDVEQQLALGLSDFLKLKMDQNSKRPSSSAELQYVSMYCNIDRMLKKLPIGVVEDLNMEFLQMIHAEIKKHDPTNVVQIEPIE